METKYTKYQNPNFRKVAEIFYLPSVQEKLKRLLLDCDYEEKIESFVKEMEKVKGSKFPKKHFDIMVQLLFNDMCYTIMANVATRILMDKKEFSEETVNENLTPWIVTTAISKIRVDSSKNINIYLIKLWRKIKK